MCTWPLTQTDLPRRLPALLSGANLAGARWHIGRTVRATRRGTYPVERPALGDRRIKDGPKITHRATLRCRPSVVIEPGHRILPSQPGCGGRVLHPTGAEIRKQVCTPLTRWAAPGTL